MGWVELRVHGVSGTPPEDLLARPHVRQVDGDKKSRFFRAVDADDTILTGDDGHTIEGYHWGKYTSGSWKQSFWLALLPFGLVNLAAFMLPAPHRADGEGDLLLGPTRWRSAALGALRLMAILLTMLLSFAIALTLIEIVAGRWIPDQGWAKGRIREYAPTIATLLAGAAMAVLGGWSWFARVLGRRGAVVGLDESLLPTPKRPPSDQSSTAAAPQNTSATPFASKTFYEGDPDALTLRGFHVAAGLAVPALIATIYSEQWEWLSTVVLVVVMVATTLLGDKEGAAATGLERDPHRVSPWHRFAPWLAGLSVATAMFALAVSAWSVHGYKRAEKLDATERFIKARGAEQLDERSLQILYLGAGTLILLTVVVVGLAWSTRSMRPKDGPAWYFRPYSKGCTAIPIAGLALFLGVGYAAALVVGTSSVLQQNTGKRGKPYAATAMLERVSYAWSLALVPIVVIVLVMLVQKARSKRELQRLALVGYPEDAPFPPARLTPWRTKLASAIWFARAKNGIEFIVWTLVAVGVLLSLAIVAEAMPTPDENNASFLSGSSASPHGGAVLTQIGAWVLLGLIAGIVFLARGAFRDANLRRGVNIIWDVVAFWPHAVHPFIPTPYSLRTVGDLVERVRNHAELPVDDGRPVVVCGHSQGSLVSFAALNLLSDEECRRVGFLTFGSQLRVIFPRAFPMYVNFEAISRMHERLDGGWVNLYRDTDPLAGPVLSWNHVHRGDGGTSQSFPFPDDGPSEDPVTDLYRTRLCGDDWRLVDPVPRVEETQEAPVNALHGHSNYWSSPVWPEALAAVRRPSVRRPSAASDGLDSA